MKWCIVSCQSSYCLEGYLRLQEVWFSGPHSDVGGGYGDSVLGGTSVDWMIGRLE